MSKKGERVLKVISLFFIFIVVVFIFLFIGYMIQGYDVENGQEYFKPATTNVSLFAGIFSVIFAYIKIPFDQKVKIKKANKKLNEPYDIEQKTERTPMTAQQKIDNYFKKEKELREAEIRSAQNELLISHNISEKTFHKAMGLYERPVFKERLNPTLSQDLYTIETKEFDLLNKLGLVSQEASYPYMLNISTNEFDLRMAKNLHWYDENREIKIPKSDILESIEDGFEFEEYIANLLIRLGYKNVEVLQASGDYGTDVLAVLKGVKYAIQCKFYSNPVGISAVQEIMGGKEHYKAHVAVVATNSTFTQNARNLADSNNIIMWDGSALENMIKEKKESAI